MAKNGGVIYFDTIFNTTREDYPHVVCKNLMASLL